MASIRKEIVIEESPDNVWAAVRDVGAIHVRLVPGFVVDCRLEGDARIVTFANGMVVRELIVRSIRVSGTSSADTARVTRRPPTRLFGRTCYPQGRRTRMLKPAVARMWQGRTRESIAETYAEYHYEAGVRKLRGTKGNLGVQVFRELHGGIATFITLSYWGSRDEIRAYAGADIEKTHHLPKDPEYLLELPPTVRHFDVLVNEWTGEGPA